MGQGVKAGIRPLGAGEVSSPRSPDAAAQSNLERSSSTKGTRGLFARKKSAITDTDAAKIAEREHKEDIEARKMFLWGIFETVLSSVIFFVVTTVFYSQRMGWTTTACPSAPEQDKNQQPQLLVLGCEWRAEGCFCAHRVCDRCWLDRQQEPRARLDSHAQSARGDLS